MFTFVYPSARHFAVAGISVLTLAALGGCADSPIAPVEELEGEVARIGVAAAMAATGPVVPVAADASPIQLGKLVQLVALDAAGDPVAARWFSSDTTVLTVSSDGVALGVGAGSATITASTRSQSVSAAIATARSAIPTGGRYVSPDEDLFGLAAAASEGTTFIIRAGVHRLRSEIYAKNGQTFIGEPGAVLSGARLLTSFSREGSAWVVTGQTQFAPTRGIGQCRTGFERCGYSEQLFFDDVPLKHVASKAALGPGKWFFDYDADKIYFHDDPTGRKVETSVRLVAFTGNASNVTIRGFTIEKFATPAGWGAVHPWDGTQGSIAHDWLVENNLIRWNQGGATKLADGMRLLNNRLVSNGQLGIQGLYARNAIVEGNEIAHNNTAGYTWVWEAGGTKFVQTDGLVVRNNHVHHNYGPGLWTDIDNIRTLYEGNLVEDNENAGIFHEISYSAIIRNNTVRRNGFGHPDWMWGAGILIAASGDVEVYGNTLTGNADGIALVQQVRGTGLYGPYHVKNAHIHHNTVTQSTGTTGGLQVGDPELFNRNNRFEANTYHLKGSAKYFTWMDGDRTDAEWRRYGNDAAGEIVR